MRRAACIPPTAVLFGFASTAHAGVSIDSDIDAVSSSAGTRLCLFMIHFPFSPCAYNHGNQPTQL